MELVRRPSAPRRLYYARTSVIQTALSCKSGVMTVDEAVRNARNSTAYAQKCTAPAAMATAVSLSKVCVAPLLLSW